MNSPRPDEEIVPARLSDSERRPLQHGGATPRLVLLVLLLATLLLYLFTNVEESELPTSASAIRSRIPTVRFDEITDEAGIKFTHHNGAAGEKLLPETMGGGCGFFDFDNDGDQDLMLINSTSWPWSPNRKRATHALYRNNGEGKFEDVTPGSGLDIEMYGMGVAFGDFDRDSRVDVFITGVAGNKLFRNEGGGKFADVTVAAGLAQTNAWSTSAAWVDIDNDGDLDLFVCNYVEWSREIDLKVDYKLTGIGRAYGPPMSFAGSFPMLYRNDGDGRFVDISAEAGVQVKNRATGAPMAKSLGVSPVDIDRDGWIDLIVANDTVQNFVFHNNRNGTFREVGAISGIAYGPYGSPRGAMGIDTGHFEDESALGVSIGNFANEMTALYVSRQNPLIFSDEAVTQGIGDASRNFLSFGVFFFDYDLDGWLDLLIANGHIEPEVASAMRGQRYAQPAGLFWNARSIAPNAGFRLVPPQNCGPDLLQPLVGRGSAYADIDGDGDLDVIITEVGGPPALFRNELSLPRNWLRLKLVGKQSNPDAIGALARVKVGNRISTQQLMPTRGYLSQSELPLTFGIGEASAVADVTVIWPGNREQKIGPLPVNQLTVIQEK